MKTNKLIAALLVGLSIVACNKGGNKPAAGAEGDADSTMTAKDYLPSKAEIDSVSYLVGVNFGTFVKGYDFGDLNYKEVIKGIKDFVNAEGDYRSEDFEKQFKFSPNSINDAFNAYLEKRHNYVSLINKEEGEKFLAENAKKSGVTTTDSGLQYQIIEAGNGNVPGPQDTVWVRYKGTLTDGTVFDQTEEGADSVRIVLTQVIKGWTEGLQLVGEGGKIKLFIPSELGYGEQGSGSIKPNAPLIFDVELDKVGHYVAPEETPEETPAE